MKIIPPCGQPLPGRPPSPVRDRLAARLPVQMPAHMPAVMAGVSPVPPTLPVMQADPVGVAGTPVWESLRAGSHPPRRPPAGGTAAVPARLCPVCRGPVRSGYRRCFQCDLHAQSAPGLLADVVAPAAYAVKGGPLARDLWQYKSGRDGSGPAAARVLSLLLLFLHEAGPAVWRGAGMGEPTAVCVVPSGRGRPGQHPLRALAAPYLARPWLTLWPRPGGDPWARTLDPARFRAGRLRPGTTVLLLDDTWVSGASAQSAAVALKLAGAAAVAVVVVGRHLQAMPPLAATPDMPAGPPWVNRLGS